MTEFLYCIVDQRDGDFRNVFTAKNVDLAKRHFEALLMQPGSPMSLFPADFYLTELGSYDTVTGKFSNTDFIKPICTGVELAMAIKQNISSLCRDADLSLLLGYLEELNSQNALPDSVKYALASEANRQKQATASALSDSPAEPATHEQRKAEVLGLKMHPDRSDSETCEEVNK